MKLTEPRFENWPFNNWCFGKTVFVRNTVAKVRSKNYNDVDVKIKVRIKVLKKSSPINH